MTEQYFLEQLKHILQSDDIDAKSMLYESGEWDSLAFVQLIGFFDKHFGKKITFKDLEKCFTPDDIILLADGAIQK